jgi:hypothetical protein
MLTVSRTRYGAPGNINTSGNERILNRLLYLDALSAKLLFFEDKRYQRGSSESEDMRSDNGRMTEDKENSTEGKNDESYRWKGQDQEIIEILDNTGPHPAWYPSPDEELRLKCNTTR